MSLYIYIYIYIYIYSNFSVARRCHIFFVSIVKIMEPTFIFVEKLGRGGRGERLIFALLAREVDATKTFLQDDICVKTLRAIMFLHSYALLGRLVFQKSHFM